MGGSTLHQAGLYMDVIAAARLRNSRPSRKTERAGRVQRWASELCCPLGIGTIRRHRRGRAAATNAEAAAVRPSPEAFAGIYLVDRARAWKCRERGSASDPAFAETGRVRIRRGGINCERLFWAGITTSGPAHAL